MKPKVILYIATSQDGYIAGNNNDVSWLDNFNSQQVTENYNSFIKNVDTIVMGYITYDVILKQISDDQWPYKNIKTYVFTTKQLKDDHKNKIYFINSNLNESIIKIKNTAKKNVWICGGANLINQLIKLKIIDELQIFTFSIQLNEGVKLFNNSFPKEFILKRTKIIKPGKLNIYKLITT